MSGKTPEQSHQTIGKFMRGMDRSAALWDKWTAERPPVTTHGKPEKEAREKLERVEANIESIDTKVSGLAELIDATMDETGRDVFVARDESGDIAGFVRVEYLPDVDLGVHRKEGVVVTYTRPRSRTREKQVTTFRFGEEGLFSVSQQGKPDNGQPNPFEAANASYEGGLAARTYFDEKGIQQVHHVVTSAVEGIGDVLRQDHIESQASTFA